MGFNKLFLPDVTTLKSDLVEFGNHEFCKRWKRRYEKADAIYGSVEAMQFIEQILDYEYNNQNALEDAQNYKITGSDDVN